LENKRCTKLSESHAAKGKSSEKPAHKRKKRKCVFFYIGKD